MDLPFVKVCHRNGRVHLTFVRKWLGRRMSTVVRLSPEQANKIADELRGKQELEAKP